MISYKKKNNNTYFCIDLYQNKNNLILKNIFVSLIRSLKYCTTHNKIFFVFGLSGKAHKIEIPFCIHINNINEQSLQEQAI